MTGLTDLQSLTLEEVKKHTKSAPVTGTVVANRIGLKERETGKDGADMRSIINALRVKGYPVCAYGAGYYWPASREELREYIDSFEGRINDQQKAVDGMKEGYALFGGDVLTRGPVAPSRVYQFEGRAVFVPEEKGDQWEATHANFRRMR